MRMARVNVYLPDDLAEAARQQDLNISALTQQAVRNALAAAATDRWLASLPRHGPSSVTSEEVVAAVHAARDEMGTRSDE
jgi:post-segregation antitoxin (ccd killing protein)